MHAARADGLTVPTYQAQLEVLAVRRSRLDAALVESLDQVDAPARRFGFVAGLQIGRTVLQAQAAVDALRQICRRRRDDAQIHIPSGIRADAACALADGES